MAKGGLTPKQRRFVEAYSASLNATEAAKVAGYSKKTAHSQGPRLLENVEIARALKDREKKDIRPHVANRERRQKFWTDAMLDEKAKMADRLKASELLGKSEGDFLERHEIPGMTALPPTYITYVDAKEKA